MNKRGFTLIEILSVIVLIALLLGLGVPAVMKISENMKKRAYNTKINIIEQGAILWGQDNKTRLQTDTCNIDGVEVNCHKIPIKDLIENDYISSDEIGVDKSTSPIDNSVISNNYAYVYKKNNRVYAKVSTEPAFELPAYTINGNEFKFVEDEYNDYKDNHKFYYQLVSSGCSASGSWTEFDLSFTGDFTNNLVYVKMEQKDIPENSIEKLVKGFRVCTSDGIASNSWHTNDFDIIIASAEDVYYDWNSSTTYSELYKAPINFNELTSYKTLYIKSGTTKTNYICRLDKEQPKIDNFNLEYLSSNKITLSADISDDLRLQYYKFVEGDNCDNGSYTYTSNISQSVSTTKTLTADTQYSLCVQDFSGKVTKYTQQTPIIDNTSPEVVDSYLKVEYNTTNGEATMKAKIKDDVKLAGYLFTKSTTCPTDISKYKVTSGTSQQISESLGVADGVFYLCVRDHAGNITKSNSRVVANCVITKPSYTCVQDSSCSGLFGCIVDVGLCILDKCKFNYTYTFTSSSSITTLSDSELKFSIDDNAWVYEDIKKGKNTIKSPESAVKSCYSTLTAKVQILEPGSKYLKTCYTTTIKKTN